MEFGRIFFGKEKYDCIIKAKEMFSFLPLINNSVITTRLSFLLQSISVIISNMTNILCLVLIDFQYRHKYHSYYSYKYHLIEALELKYLITEPLYLLIKKFYFASYGSLPYK